MFIFSVSVYNTVTTNRHKHYVELSIESLKRFISRICPHGKWLLRDKQKQIAADNIVKEEYAFSHSLSLYLDDYSECECVCVNISNIHRAHSPDSFTIHRLPASQQPVATLPFTLLLFIHFLIGFQVCSFT